MIRCKILRISERQVSSKMTSSAVWEPGCLRKMMDFEQEIWGLSITHMGISWKTGGWWSGWWFGTFFFHILGTSSSQLTSIFFRGVGWNHQPGEYTLLHVGTIRIQGGIFVQNPPVLWAVGSAENHWNQCSTMMKLWEHDKPRVINIVIIINHWNHNCSLWNPEIDRNRAIFQIFSNHQIQKAPSNPSWQEFRAPLRSQTLFFL